MCYFAVHIFRLAHCYSNIYTSSGDGVEAHLVSVKASSSLSTDGSSSTRLCMGYFWILDRLESELKLPRRQRLVCHSNLPRSAGVYTENDQYEAIMDDLTKQGVFSSSYSGSADLADIHIAKLPSGKVKEYHDYVTGFSQEYINYIRDVEKVRSSFLISTFCIKTSIPYLSHDP